MVKEDPDSLKSVVNVPSMSAYLRFHLCIISLFLGLHNALRNEKFSAFSECLNSPGAKPLHALTCVVQSSQRKVLLDIHLSNEGFLQFRYLLMIKKTTCTEKDNFINSNET